MLSGPHVQVLLYWLLSAGSAVLPKPRRQLRFLLRFQVDAVIDTLDRLFIGALRRRDFVSREEIRHLVAHRRIAARIAPIW